MLIRFCDGRDELLTLEKERSRLKQKLIAANEDVDRLAKSKIAVIEGTSHQIETLRDEICNLNDKLQIQTIRVEELTRLRATHESDEKSDHEFHDETEGAYESTNYLSRAGQSSFWSMGRSRFSTPLWKQTVTDANESKRRLAQETAKEIQRLREIIKVLSNAPGSKDHNIGGMMDTLGRRVGVQGNRNENSNSNQIETGDSTRSLKRSVPIETQRQSSQSQPQSQPQAQLQAQLQAQNYNPRYNEESKDDPFIMDDEKEAPPGVDRMSTSIVWQDVCFFCFFLFCLFWFDIRASVC